MRRVGDRWRTGWPAGWRAGWLAAVVVVAVACSSADGGVAGPDDPPAALAGPDDTAREGTSLVETSPVVTGPGAEHDPDGSGGSARGETLCSLAGGEDDDPPSTATSTDPPSSGTSITLWHSLGGDQTFEAFDALVRDFDEAHPDITVEATRIEGYVNALRRLRETDPDDFPDLFMAAVDNVRLLAESGVFVPPRACWGEDPPVLDDVLPVIRATLTVDGTLWAYPSNISTPVLLYDRTLLVEAGFDPDRLPVSAADLAELVAAITAAGDAPGGLVLSEQSAGWLVEQWAVPHGNLLVEPDNGLGGHPVEGVRFATDEAVAALEWARDLNAAGLVSWVGANQSGIDDLLRLVDLSDRASFTMHTSAALGDVAWLVYEMGLEDLAGAELGVAPLPSPTGDPGALVGGGSLWLLDNGDPVATGAAVLFAEFLMAPENHAMFTAATGYVPATAAAVDHPLTAAHWEQFPQFAVAYRQLAGQGTTPAEVGMQIGPRVLVQRVLESAAADVVVGGADARERLEQAEQQALAIIEQYELDGGQP